MWQRLCQSLRDSFDLLLPPACLLCGQPLDPDVRIAFCADCLAQRSSVGPARCRRCADPYPKATSDHLCPACLKNPPEFSRVCAAGLYQGSLREAVSALKYRGRVMLAKPLGQLLDEALPDPFPSGRPQCIIPVPLHPRRLKSRGFNQAVEIARPLARQRDLPLAVNLLERVRNTPSQQELSATERGRNLTGAFALCGPLPTDRILLIDDIMTTGATVRECSRVLRQGGATQIDVAVVGRA